MKYTLLAATLFTGALMLSATAEATPYAYASNQYTDLRLVLVVGGTPQTMPVTGNPSETISASAIYGGYPASVSQATQPIPIFPATGTLDISQAFSGTGTIPAENTWTPAGPGTFTGTRADASIGGADSTGAITANNVSEGNGYLLGNSSANNNATIVFQIVLATVGKVQLSFQNIVSLIAATSAFGESATASVTNTFSITQGGIGGVSYSYAPTEINGQIASQDAVPVHNTYGTTFAGFYQSPDLQPGTYNISITSGSAETIHSVPEPASLALLGAGLVGLGLVRRRKA